MLDFEFKNPTKIIFGKNKIANIAKEIPANAKVLMLYGGGSIKTNGIYEQVIAGLSNFEVVEFGGIPANPEYSVLMEALHVIKTQGITYLLAVGGGSVIDGTKFLSAAALYQGLDPWEILAKPIRTEVGMPFGTVLTLPATGSEMNSGAVITRAEIQMKLGMGGPGLFPQFSILDPQVIASLPHRQIANGIVDAFVHVLEQYVTYNVGAHLQDRIAESILQTLVEIAPKLSTDRTDYELASNFMWSCTMALNGLIQKGVPSDWSIHAIGHELTALYEIDHARTLAIICPSLYRYKFENKKAKLAQLGARVWDITEGTLEENATETIRQIEMFFRSLGMSTSLRIYAKEYQLAPKLVASRLASRGWVALGEHKDITPSDVEAIVKMSL
jgi:NADP-dependent alcohol dehydrogenase